MNEENIISDLYEKYKDFLVIIGEVISVYKKL